jgi:DNA-directed RNA polymerase subunit RPC12/RpoP
MNGKSKIIEKTTRTKAMPEYNYCPHCGRKGLYHLHGKYCRCRYCGLYRILLRESDFREELATMAPVPKRSA